MGLQSQGPREEDAEEGIRVGRFVVLAASVQVVDGAGDGGKVEPMPEDVLDEPVGFGQLPALGEGALPFVVEVVAQITEGDFGAFQGHLLVETANLGTHGLVSLQ